MQEQKPGCCCCWLMRVRDSHLGTLLLVWEILTSMRIVIDIGMRSGIAIHIVHACIQGSFLRSSIGTCSIATSTRHWCCISAPIWTTPILTTRRHLNPHTEIPHPQSSNCSSRTRTQTAPKRDTNSRSFKKMELRNVDSFCSWQQNPSQNPWNWHITFMENPSTSISTCT